MFSPRFTEQPLAFVPHAKWPHGSAGARWEAELRHGLASFAAAPFHCRIRFTDYADAIVSFRRPQTGETVKIIGRTQRWFKKINKWRNGGRLPSPSSLRSSRGSNRREASGSR